MIKRDWPRLFYEHDLRAVIEHQRAELRSLVREIPEHTFNQQTDEFLAATVASKLVIAAIELHEETIEVSKRDAQIDVSHDFNRVQNPFGPTLVDGLEVTYHLPFSGDPKLFQCKPRTWTSVIPRAVVGGTELRFPYDSPDRSVEATHRFFQEDLKDLKTWLGSVNEQVTEYNAQLEPSVRLEVVKRRADLERDMSAIQALGYGLRGSTTKGTTSRADAVGSDEALKVREAKRSRLRRSFDVALSFAGEDRDYVEDVASALQDLGLTVFYDRFEQVGLWGKDLADHFGEVYGKNSRFVVLFASRHYAAKAWPNHEKSFALSRHLKGDRETILPVRFDNTEIPGIPSTIAYLDVRALTPTQLAELIRQKVDLEGDL